MSLIHEGAEAQIIQDTLKKDRVIKKRQTKQYRHPELDSYLRKRRTKLESKLLIAAHPLSPLVYETAIHSIVLEKIEGQTLGSYISLNNKLPFNLGAALAELHSKAIVHGDLTTSNILVDSSEDIKFIDFGLGKFSKKIEDIAVDLHIFKQIIESEHPESANTFWETLLKGYNLPVKKEVISRLEKLELRGRYKKK